MANIERRSGVDLVRLGTGWGVVFNGKLLSVHGFRGDALAAARVESMRVLADADLRARTAKMVRLQHLDRSEAWEETSDTDSPPA